jgi:5-hydroxyisourate hydrolase
MAILSTHTLDSVTGDSAKNVRVQLFRLLDDFKKELIFETYTNHEGRLSEIFSSAGASREDFELVFHIGEYLRQQNLQEVNPVMDSVVIRLNVCEFERNYHIPLLIAPHNFTVWWSGTTKV